MGATCKKRRLAREPLLGLGAEAVSTMLLSQTGRNHEHRALAGVRVVVDRFAGMRVELDGNESQRFGAVLDPVTGDRRVSPELALERVFVGEDLTL